MGPNQRGEVHRTGGLGRILRLPGSKNARITLPQGGFAAPRPGVSPIRRGRAGPEKQAWPDPPYGRIGWRAPSASPLRWQAGYFPNAILLRNSWLVHGVHLEGAANLMSLHNVYGVGGIHVGVTAVDNPRAGETSNLASCGDRVLDVVAGQVSPAPADLFSGLLSPARFCP